MNTNNSFLQAIKILIKESINSAPYNRTKQAIIVSNNGDNTYDIRFDGKLYTNIISYPNTRSLPLKHIVKVIIPNNQASQMYISAEGSPLIYYPVGSYYETSDTSFNPNTSWGGTWTLETEGLVHIGAGSTYSVGDTGGSKTVKLSAAIGAATGAPATLNYIADTINGYQSAVGRGSYTIQGASWTSNQGWSHSTPVTEHNSASRDTNIMQPYIVVNRWHRTA